MKLLRENKGTGVNSEAECFILQNSMNQYTYYEWLSPYTINALNYLSAVITEGNMDEANHTMDHIMAHTSSSLT